MLKVLNRTSAYIDFSEGKKTLGKFIASQIFGIPAAYVASVGYSSVFNTSPPIAVPLLAWLITSLYVIAKL